MYRYWTRSRHFVTQGVTTVFTDNVNVGNWVISPTDTVLFQLINQIHDQAHFGHERVTSYLQNYFFFPKMGALVKNGVNT